MSAIWSLSGEKQTSIDQSEFMGSRPNVRRHEALPAARRANQFVRGLCLCPALFAKIFRFPRRANHLYKLAPSRPDKRGVAHVINAGRDAVDAEALLTNGADADGEAVWS